MASSQFQKVLLPVNKVNQESTRVAQVFIPKTVGAGVPTFPAINACNFDNKSAKAYITQVEDVRSRPYKQKKVLEFKIDRQKWFL